MILNQHASSMRVVLCYLLTTLPFWADKKHSGRCLDSRPVGGKLTFSHGVHVQVYDPWGNIGMRVLGDSA